MQPSASRLIFSPVSPSRVYSMSSPSGDPARRPAPSSQSYADAPPDELAEARLCSKKLGWDGGAPGRDASRRSPYRPAAVGGASHLARYGPPRRAPAQRPCLVRLGRPDGADLQHAHDGEG